MLISVSRSQDMDPKMHAYFTPRMVGFNALSDAMLSSIWSPIVWNEGKRKRKNFLSTKLCALDFDNGEWSLRDAENWCRENGYSAIIGTSKSHQKEKTTAAGKVSAACDRFRLVVPFSKPITDREQYEWNMRHIFESLPCDESCSDAARFFYPCKELVYRQAGLRALPVEEVPPGQSEAHLLQDAVKEMEAAKFEGILPGWILTSLWWGCEEGGRHKLCYRLGIHLTLYGDSVAQIVTDIMTGPLASIGREQVERAVQNGANRAKGIKDGDE